MRATKYTKRQTCITTTTTATTSIMCYDVDQADIAYTQGHNRRRDCPRRSIPGTDAASYAVPTPIRSSQNPVATSREQAWQHAPVYHVIPSRNSFTTRENSSCISAAAACVRRYSGSTGTTLSGTTSGEVGLAAQTNATSNAISTTTAVIVERYLVMLQLVGVSVKMEMGREGVVARYRGTRERERATKRMMSWFDGFEREISDCQRIERSESLFLTFILAHHSASIHATYSTALAVTRSSDRAHSRAESLSHAS